MIRQDQSTGYTASFFRSYTRNHHSSADGGTVLIPAFSIGRTQDILYELESLIDEFIDELVAGGLSWRDLQVVVDSHIAPIEQPSVDIN